MYLNAWNEFSRLNRKEKWEKKFIYFFYPSFLNIFIFRISFSYVVFLSLEETLETQLFIIWLKTPNRCCIKFLIFSNIPNHLWQPRSIFQPILLACNEFMIRTIGIQIYGCNFETRSNKIHIYIEAFSLFSYVHNKATADSMCRSTPYVLVYLY